MSSIKLHKEFGLNPTISTCFYCGKEKNEIALLGAAYKEHAPMHMCTSLEPCDECKAKIGDGAFLVEATMNDKGNPVPTGAYIGVSRRYADSIGVGKIAFVEPGVLQKITKQE